MPRREAPPASPPPPPPRRDPAGGAPSAENGGENPASPPRGGRNRLIGERAPLTEQGLRGFRDVVAEAETLGEKTAQANKSARQAYAAVPTDIPELDRVEPRLEPSPPRPPREAAPPRDAPAAREAATPREAPTLREALAPREVPPPPREQPSPPEAGPSRPREGAPPPRRPLEPPPRAPEPRPPSHLPVLPTDEHGGFEPARSRKALVAVLLTLFVILGIALTVYVMRDRIAALTGAMQRLAPQGQKDQAPSRPKIPDRVGQDAQPAAPGPKTEQTAPAQQQALPAVAQRVVLYEEDPADPNGKRFVGSAVWRTETVTPGTGQAPELAVRADVEIPERRLGMTMSIRRNADQALPASHTVEIMFNLPADFPFGGISNVPGILMKQSEQTRGAPLSGLAVKVTSGFFLLGLSSVDTEKERNIQLLKERAWFDIPVVYNNGRRAILAVEKGNPGERAFKDAFAAWGQ